MDDYPIAVIQDRYSGAYSGGRWLAIACADQFVDENTTRVQFCLTGQDGPFDSDVEAAGFWENQPDWVAVGQTPDDAIDAVRANAARSQREARVRNRKLRTNA